MEHTRLPSRVGLRLGRLSLALTLAAGLVLAPVSAEAQSSDSLRERRDEVRRQRAEVASQLDVLRATDEEMEDALAALEANVVAQETAYEEAQEAKAAADEELATAREQVRAKQAEVAAREKDLQDAAVAAFIRPPSSSTLEALESKDLSEAEVKKVLVETRQANGMELLEKLEAARDALERARQRSEEAADEAKRRQRLEGEALAYVDAARYAQALKVAEIDERIGRRLAEAQSLAQLDQELSAKYEAQQREIARKLAAAAARAEAAKKAQSAAAPAPGPSGGGAPPTVTGSGSIVSVRGIQVHRSIANNLANLLGAADRAGIHLTGGGYRSPASQVQTRRNNCGSSNYAIYHMPASSCRPPTAKPGASMHEKGLAVDFAHNGRVISSRGSTAFRWLAANAGSYGFRNLPSEPWHWSTNGQ